MCWVSLNRFIADEFVAILGKANKSVGLCARGLSFRTTNRGGLLAKPPFPAPRPRLLDGWLRSCRVAIPRGGNSATSCLRPEGWQRSAWRRGGGGRSRWLGNGKKRLGMNGARLSTVIAEWSDAQAKAPPERGLPVRSTPQTHAIPKRSCHHRFRVPNVLVLPLFCMQPYPLRESDLLRTQEVRAPGELCSAVLRVFAACKNERHSVLTECHSCHALSA